MRPICCIWWGGSRDHLQCLLEKILWCSLLQRQHTPLLLHYPMLYDVMFWHTTMMMMMWSAFKVASVTSTKSLFYIYKWKQVLPPPVYTTTHSTPALWSNPWMAKTLHPDESLTFIFQYYAMLNSFEFLDFPISRPFLVSLCEILSFWQLVTFYNFLQLAANPQRVRADLHKLPLRPVFKHEAAQLR